MRPVTLSLALALCFPSAGMAQPALPHALHGSVSVVQNGAQTIVTTGNGIGSNHSAINWQSFGVPSGTGTWFNQPGATSTSINRVTGPDPSLILGRLGSNGRLVLVNPAGIAVGAGAAVDTAGFTASTLALSPVDAIAGRLRFGSDGGKAGGTLSVQGQIVARHGDIVLIAPQIETGASATIESSGGDTILAAGRKVELTGRGLEGIRLQIQAPDDSAVNLGRLKGDSVGVFASQLRHSGAIQASSASAVGGRVVLSGRSLAEIDGRITAVAGDKGGSVHVSAERLVLKSTTSIDVSGRVQGGEVLAGGGWQGQDSRVANARTVDVEPGVQLRADATLSGNGGTVVVWSDERTAFAGSLSARGAGSGDGGNAEVSGKQQLRFRGRADLGSPTGKTGTLLLDPATVTIQGGNGSSTDPATIFQSDIEANVANTVIQASQQIQVAGAFINGELTVQGGGIRFEVTPGAPGGIDLRGMPITSQGGNVDLVTASAGQDIYPDRITTSGTGAIGINAAKARVTLSNVSLSTSLGNVTIYGNPASGPGVLLAATSIRTSGGRGDAEDNRRISITSPAGIEVRDTTFASGSTTFLSAAGSTVAFSGANQLFQDVKVQAQLVTNSGDLRITGPASLEMENSAFQNSGSFTLLNGAGIEAGSVINLGGGVIAGVGTIEIESGSLQNYGTLQPGGVAAIGRLQIEGRLLNGNGAEVVMDVAGSNSYDTLSVEGELQLGGTLKVVSLAYSPAPGDRYTLFTSGSTRGRFGAIAAPSFPGFDAVYGARTTAFQAVAQPPAPAPVASAPPDSAPAPAPAAAPATAPAPAPAAAPAPAPAAVAAPAPAAASPGPASAPVPVPTPSPDVAPAPAPAVADATVPTPSPEAGPGAAPVPTPVAVAGPAPAAAPTSAPGAAPATTAPATAGNTNPAAPVPGPAPAIAGPAPSMPGFRNDPVVVAAVRQQTSQLDAFVARAPVPVSLAASPRSKDDDDVAVTAVQCVPGNSAPSRLPLAVIRPAFDWWR